jgi:hypothetical protein
VLYVPVVDPDVDDKLTSRTLDELNGLLGELDVVDELDELDELDVLEGLPDEVLDALDELPDDVDMLPSELNVFVKPPIKVLDELDVLVEKPDVVLSTLLDVLEAALDEVDSNPLLDWDPEDKFERLDATLELLDELLEDGVLVGGLNPRLIPIDKKPPPADVLDDTLDKIVEDKIEEDADELPRLDELDVIYVDDKEDVMDILLVQ